MKSVEELEQELNQLKNRVAYIEDYLVKTTNPSVQVRPIERVVASAERQYDMTAPVESGYGTSPLPSPTANWEPVPQHKKPVLREEVIGKNVMGVLASILIFIGLCSLGALVYASLTDIMKSGIVHLISFGIMGVGLWRVGKKKNAFSLSLSAIGLSSVYISIMIDAWLGIIDPVFMGVLLVAWGLLNTAIAFKYKSSLFSVISYIGFNMGVYLGVLDFCDTASIVLFLFIFQSIYGVVLLYKRYWESDTFKNVMSFIVLVTQLLYFWTASSEKLAFEYALIYYFLGVAFLIYSTYMYYERSKGVGFSAYLACGLVMMFSVNFVLAASYRNDSCWIYMFTGVLLYASSIVMGYFKISGTQVYDYIVGLFAIYYVFDVWSDWSNDGTPEQLCMSLMLFGAIAFAYFLLKDIHYKHVGIAVCISSLYCLTCPDKFGLAWAFLLLVIYGGLFAVHAYMSVSDNSAICKALMFGVLWYMLFRFVGALSYVFSLSTEVRECGWIFISVALLAAMSLSGYCTKYSSVQELCSHRDISKLDGSFYVYVVSSYFILVSLLIYMADVEEVPYMLLYTMLSMVLCCMNSTLIYKKLTSSSGYILGIQYTVYVYALLQIWTGKYDIEFVYSLVCLILAVLCILGGFHIKEKSFRIYGLLLSITCVLKLVFIDISYDNSIARVMGYIVGGFICLFIVGVYNKIEQMQRGEE